MANEKPGTIRPTDAEAIRLARQLARGARFGALAVLDPQTGHPHVSRTLVATDIDATPVILASTLALHTRAILEDGRCSLLVGEPGRGDPLAWPRLSILADAERVDPESESHEWVRRRFLRRHPKAKLYADFSDFSFYRLRPSGANLNGGFGKSYNISDSELLIDSELNFDLCSSELQVIAAILALGDNVADLLAARYFKDKTVGWEVSGLDAQGMEIANKEKFHRIEIDAGAPNISGLIAVYSNILKSIR